VQIRKTKQREAIREVFEQAGRPLSMEEVLREAQAECGSLGVATVYRNVKGLVEEGWLAVVALPGEAPRYERSGKAHHHHFHCRACGQVYELEGCAGDFGGMAPRGFEVTGHEVILYGRCEGCRSQAAPARPSVIERER